jgi:hypothetical protein
LQLNTLEGMQKSTVTPQIINYLLVADFISVTTDNVQVQHSSLPSRSTARCLDHEMRITLYVVGPELGIGIISAVHCFLRFFGRFLRLCMLILLLGPAVPCLSMVEMYLGGVLKQAYHTVAWVFQTVCVSGALVGTMKAYRVAFWGRSDNQVKGGCMPYGTYALRGDLSALQLLLLSVVAH